MSKKMKHMRTTEVSLLYLDDITAQVCSVLDSLEREYKREDDWLSRHASGDHDRATLILQLINKHQEQKEAFLKACTLARRTAETFLKYSNRSLQYFTHPNESTFRGPETKVKSKSSWRSC